MAAPRANNHAKTADYSGNAHSRLGPGLIFTFGFGTIVGVAWVVLMGDLLREAGFAGAFLGLTAGAALILVIALCYSEMGARYPLAGGEVAYAREVFGHRSSYLVGWFLLLSCILVCGFEMVSVGWLAAQLWPGIARTRLYSVLGQDVFLEPLSASLAVQLLIFWVNYRGTRDAGRLQAVATGGKLLLSGCFIFAALCVAHPVNRHPLFILDANGSLWPGVITVATVAPFWFSGFNAVSQTLGERAVEISAKMAANLSILSLLAAWIFYSLVLTSMTLVMPRQALLGHSLPTAAAFEMAFGSAAVGKVVLFAAMLGLVSTWNALYFSATRVLAVLAQDGFVASRFGRPHAYYGTPTYSIIAVAIAIPVCALLGRGIIGPLLSLFSVIMAGIYATVCGAVLVLHRRDIGRRTRASDWLPYIALGACALIAGFGMIEPLKAWRDGRWPIELIGLAAWTAWGLWMGNRRGDQITVIG